MTGPGLRVAVLLIALAVLGAIGWSLRETALVQWLLRTATASDPAPAAAAPGARGTMAPTNKAMAGVHKCRSGPSVTYTDRPCPPGSRMEPVVEGPVTVLPSPPPPAAAPARLPHVRDLALDGDEQRLRDQRMEQAIGR